MSERKKGAEEAEQSDATDERSRTDKGYDEAARSGPSVYGVPTGEGGVFGTSGGGSFDGGMHVEERPMPYVYPDDEGRESDKK